MKGRVESSKFEKFIEELKFIRELENNPNRISTDLPEGTRVILDVENHSIICSGVHDSTTNPLVDSFTVVQLLGRKSPSSPAVSQAYIIFVPDGGKLRTPAYTNARETIHIWLFNRNLPAFLNQLHEPNVYCWIGHFENNYIYADVHTSH